MKRPLFLLTATLCATLPALSQPQIAAPQGWKTQVRAGGATTFTPPDLRAGESYSVTAYAPAPPKGKTPEAWLRDFAGPVGTEPGTTVGAAPNAGKEVEHHAAL